MAVLVFDKYEVIRRLVVGGMGEIFLARQKDEIGVDRLIILKSLLPTLAEDPVQVGQFLDEARVAASLNHPNIVSLFEVGRWRGTYFIAMEYIEGHTIAGILLTAIQANLTIPIEAPMRIIKDAASALAYAHEATDPEGVPLHIVHRDVSPQNIMVRKDGLTKVVDFGIAKAAIQSIKTATGVIKGKVRYMSPEQIRGAEVDARSDQFSLGVVFWEFLAQQNLFRKGSTEVEVLQWLSNNKIPKPSTRNGAVPQELDDMVLKMTRIEPNERYPDCQTIAKELDHLLNQQSPRPETSRITALLAAVSEHEPRKPGSQGLGMEFLLPLGPADENSSATPAREGYTPSSGAPIKARRQPRRLRTWWVVAAALASMLCALVIAVKPLEQANENMSQKAPAAGTPTTTPNERRPAHLKAEVKHAFLTIDSDPKGADVFVGDKHLGTTPLTTRKLTPKTAHQVRVGKAGFHEKNLELKLSENQEKKVLVRLKALPRRRPRTTSPKLRPPKPNNTSRGFLSVDTTPWTEVAIDGTPRGSTPLYRIELAPGKHRLRLTNVKKNITQEKIVSIQPGKTKKLHLDLSAN